MHWQNFCPSFGLRRKGPSSSPRTSFLAKGLLNLKIVRGSTRKAYLCFYHFGLWVDSHSSREKKLFLALPLHAKVVINPAKRRLKDGPAWEEAGRGSWVEAETSDCASGRRAQRGGKLRETPSKHEEPRITFPLMLSYTTFCDNGNVLSLYCPIQYPWAQCISWALEI